MLEVLGISHLQHRMIGSPGFGGVSMEVSKKCTIAVELIMEPALLFLDEPTTGLDSAGAFAVLTSMQLLAQGQGMTVVCTIHQPSAELALMFDNIILMQPGGHVAYFGPFHDLPDWFDAAPTRHTATRTEPGRLRFRSGEEGAAGQERRRRGRQPARRVQGQRRGQSAAGRRSPPASCREEEKKERTSRPF